MTAAVVTAEVLLVGGLVAAVVRGHRARFILKPIASLAFIAVGLLEAQDSPGTYALLVLIGLALGAVGDIALLFEGQRLFLFGLSAFLAGHLAYLAAFVIDASPRFAVVGVMLGAALGWYSYRWLRPHLPPPFDKAVLIYVVAICLMVAAGAGQGAIRPSGTAGAALFALSDLAVARDRFITRSLLNPALGLPLYYLAQVLIALSI